MIILMEQKFAIINIFLAIYQKRFKFTQNISIDRMIESTNQSEFARFCNHILQLRQGDKEKGNLFLGSVGALKEEIINTCKISAVLTVMDKYIYDKRDIPKKIETLCISHHKWINIEDSQEVSISDYFEQSFNFIDETLQTCNLLVHCQAGISRSATIVISYLMKKLQLNLELANKLVVSKRYFVSPNEGFWKALEKHEKVLQTQKEVKKQKEGDAIQNPFSQFTTQKYPQKFANHIICLQKDGNIQYGNLFLGQFSILKSHFLKSLKIKTVLSVVDETYFNRMKIKPILEHEGLGSMWINIKDEPSENIGLHFGESFQFIEKHIKEGNVLVHCQAGVSRSASIVIAFIMRKFQVDYKQAHDFVKSKRKVINPNSGFQERLIQFSQKMSKN